MNTLAVGGFPLVIRLAQGSCSSIRLFTDTVNNQAHVSCWAKGDRVGGLSVIVLRATIAVFVCPIEIYPQGSI